MANYRIPKAAKQRLRDKAYLEFQSEPKLNELSIRLRLESPRCDTILGGKRIWLRGTRSSAPYDQYKFPIVVDGERCPNEANRTFRENSKNVRRCRHHERNEYWIPND